MLPLTEHLKLLNLLRLRRCRQYCQQHNTAFYKSLVQCSSERGNCSAANEDLRIMFGSSQRPVTGLHPIPIYTFTLYSCKINFNFALRFTSSSPKWSRPLSCPGFSFTNFLSSHACYMYCQFYYNCMKKTKIKTYESNYFVSVFILLILSRSEVNIFASGFFSQYFSQGKRQTFTAM